MSGGHTGVFQDTVAASAASLVAWLDSSRPFA